MTPPHIVLAAANVSIDASRRIVDLLASRPVDAELMAEVLQIAHEADVKVRALLTPPPPAPPDPTRWIRALHPDGPSIRLRGAIREAGHTSVHVDASEVEAAWPTMSDAQREGWQSVSVTVTEGGNAASLTAPTGGLVGVATNEPDDVGVLHDLRRRLLAEDIDALVVVDEEPGANAVARVLDAYFAEGALRCLRTRAGYPNGSTVRVVTARDLDAHPDMIAASCLDVAVVLAPISAAALDEVRARLLRNRGTLIGLGAPVLSIRTPAESFADAGPTLSVPIRAEDVTITASPTYPDPDTLDTGDFGAIRPGGKVLDEPLDPSLWAQVLDRAQVAALAGERPSLVVQTEPREAGWLRDLVEPAPPSEAARIASHVAAVAPGYRERARAWLDAEHADMVEDLAALMATVSAECCS